jgi:outer membrane protein assembly factor BamB
MKKGYSTPTVIEVAGQRQLISPSAGATMAFDPASGKELWRVRSGGMNAATKPLFGFGLVYCTTASGGIQLFATKPDGSGDITETNIAWKQNKTIPSRSSPLLVGDHLFMISDKGVASCVDAKTGQQIWSQRMPGNYSASLVLAENRIYLCNEDGLCPVIEAATEYHELAMNKLDDGFMASPAITGKSLILRSKTHLYRIEN